MTNSLVDDYRYCKKIIDKNSKTFSLAFSSLPERKKNSVWAIYAFFRLLDDIVDNGKTLDVLIKEKENFYNMINGIEIESPIYRALNDTFKHFSIDPIYIEAMFKGQESDIVFNQFESDNDLLDYCYNVAGSVGHTLLPILATKNYKSLYDSAKDLGIAMQITNILRDIYEDYQNKRIYLSKESLNKFNVNLEEVISNGVNENYIKLWEYYGKKAESLYISGLNEISLYDSDSQLIVKTAAIMYSKILDAVRKQKYDIKTRAVVKPNILKNIKSIILS